MYTIIYAFTISIVFETKIIYYDSVKKSKLQKYVLCYAELWSMISTLTK